MSVSGTPLVLSAFLRDMPISCRRCHLRYHYRASILLPEVILQDLSYFSPDMFIEPHEFSLLLSTDVTG